MKLFSISVIFSLLLFNCSSDSNIESGTTEIRQSDDTKYEKPYESDLLSFEMSFGTELSDTKDEFLLVFPFATCVNDEGDIIMFDEERIKVYDKYGKGKKIVGRPGQGPGEFRGISCLWLSPTGYLMVSDASLFVGRRGTTYYNLFAPDYTLIETKRFDYDTLFIECLKTEGFEIKDLRSIRKIYAINESEKVYEAHLFEKSPDPDKANKNIILLVYEDADTCIKLLRVKHPDYITLPGLAAAGPFHGYIFWSLLNDRRIVYVYTDDDINNEKIGLHYYTIHLLSLDTLEENKITCEFPPVLYPELWTDPDHYNRPGISKLQQIKIAKIRKDKKFYPSVKYAVIDGNFLFIYRYSNYDREIKKLTSSEGPVDVFDLEEEKFIGSFIFPKIFETIKDSCAYITAYNKEGFIEMRKYKIHPSVYGK